MDAIVSFWTWIVEHPAQAAWAAFALLSALVGVYKLNETKIKEIAASSETTADDRAVKVLDGLVAIFEILRLFVPHLVARPKQPTKTKEPK